MSSAQESVPALRMDLHGEYRELRPFVEEIKRTRETGPGEREGRLRFKSCLEIIRKLFQIAGVKQHKCVIACLKEQAWPPALASAPFEGEFFSFHGQLRSRSSKYVVFGVGDVLAKPRLFHDGPRLVQRKRSAQF